MKGSTSLGFILIVLLMGLQSSADELSIADKFIEKHGDHRNWQNDQSDTFAELIELSVSGSPTFDITEFGIQRAGCYGMCPAYSLLFRLDGSVHYQGNRYADHMGKREGHINVIHMTQVLRLIKESDFANLEYNYAIDITHAGSTFTLVNQDGVEKVVRNYANAGPAVLWALETAIDDLQEHVVWIDPDGEYEVALNCSGLELRHDSVSGRGISPEETGNLQYFNGGREFGSEKGQHDWMWGPVDEETGKHQYHIVVYASEIGGTFWNSKVGGRNIFCSRLGSDD